MTPWTWISVLLIITRKRPDVRKMVLDTKLVKDGDEAMKGQVDCKHAYSGYQVRGIPILQYEYTRLTT